MLDIYVDADGCPVKNEVYRVARRYGLRVILVANAWMRVPETIRIVYHGELQPWVGGKDLILHTIGQIGVDGGQPQCSHRIGLIGERLVHGGGVAAEASVGELLEAGPVHIPTAPLHLCAFALKKRFVQRFRSVSGR